MRLLLAERDGDCGYRRVTRHTCLLFRAHIADRDLARREFVGAHDHNEARAQPVGLLELRLEAARLMVELGGDPRITQRLREREDFRRDRLELGNLDARRDWGFAGDYVEGMWRMLQQERADDYVLATGVDASVREFATLAGHAFGFALEWSGGGASEVGIDRASGRTVIAVSPEHYRAADAATRIGNAAKAKAELGWAAKVTLPELVAMMAEADDRRVRDDAVMF